MLRGTVVSFSDQQAIGEVLLEDGRVYRFTLDALTSAGLPNGGAPAEVRLGPMRRGGEGVVAIALESRLESRDEPAVFLDAACGRTCVWREAAGCFAEVHVDSAFTPGDLVTLTLRQEMAFRSNAGNAPYPFALAARPGALSPALLARFERLFAEAWSRYRTRRWNDEDRTRELRGLGRVLAMAERRLPDAPVLRRLLRPMDGTPAGRLGLPLGACATALHAEARRLRPQSPAHAFRDLGLRLGGLDDEGGRDLFGFGPIPCVPFATDGGEVTYAAVDQGDRRPLDELPVVAYESDHVEVIASDLPSFLARAASGEWARDGVDLAPLAAALRSVGATTTGPVNEKALALARTALRSSG